jgi:hypothetical protein
MKRVIFAAAIVSIAMLMLGCGASTTVKTMWTDPEFQPKETPMNGVLIMGVYNQRSNALAYEAEMKKQFAAKNVKVAGSLDFWKFDEQPTKEEVQALVKEKGYEAVLVSRVTDKQTQVDYQPGYTYGGYGMGYYGYYGSSWGVVHSPGYVTSYDVLFIESNLYKVSGEKLVWVGTSEVFDPSDAMDVIKSFSASIVPTLTSKGYFVRNK